MPKTAATMIGLLLAACSIGLNMIRYPIVSEMVGPAMAVAPLGESSPPSPTAPPAHAEPPPSDHVSPHAAACPPAAAVDVRPVPDVAGVIADPAPPVANQVGRSSRAAGDGAAAVPPSMEKPLAPVDPAAISGGPANAERGGAVRRLPPVDGGPPPAFSRDRQWTGGPIPIYPSTGLR
jgi:hypothetical protein